MFFSLKQSSATSGGASPLLASWRVHSNMSHVFAYFFKPFIQQFHSGNPYNYVSQHLFVWSSPLGHSQGQMGLQRVVFVTPSHFVFQGSLKVSTTLVK